MRLTSATWLLLLAGLLATAFGCADRELTEGVDQPLSVRGAQFVRGALPGFAPLVPGAGEAAREPTTTSALADVALLRERLSGVGFSGNASPGAAAVAVRFQDVGDGYWLLPTGAPDPQAGGRLSWDFVADFNASLTAGRHTLLVVAIDADGNAGTQASSSLCIRAAIPDNGNACFSTIAPPALVISLGWDTPADLDLKVITPGNTIIESKHPSSAPAGASSPVDLTAPGVGSLDLDSNRDCLLDGRQRESVVFQRFPPRGTYKVYASLSRACGEQAANYLASYHVIQSKGEAEFGTTVSYVGAGTLLAPQANADTRLGTFVGELTIR